MADRRRSRRSDRSPIFTACRLRSCRWRRSAIICRIRRTPASGWSRRDLYSGRVSVAPARDWTAQYSIGRLEKPEALEPGSQWRQTASVEYNRPLARGNWATSLVWGRVHKLSDGVNLNGYGLESTLNFLRRNYAFTRLELVDKDELFPQAAVHPAYRIGAYTFGGTRDLVRNHAWQLGLGADVTVYSKPAALDAAYGNYPVSFQVFLRVRPGLQSRAHRP
jgi:hypothetical protein